MMTIVREAGQRPPIATIARLNAIAGAKALADLLAEEQWADLCTLTVDWEGDGHTPVLRIDTVKWMIHHDGRRIEHNWPVDIDEAFGEDNMTNSLLRQMVREIEIKIREAEQRGPSEGPRVIH